MSGCCAGPNCDCYEEGFEDGQREFEKDFDYFNAAKDHSDFHFDQIRTYPFKGMWIARIHIDLPEGVGGSEKEAIGDLIVKLSKRTTIIGVSP